MIVNCSIWEPTVLALLLSQPRPNPVGTLVNARMDGWVQSLLFSGGASTGYLASLSGLLEQQDHPIFYRGRVFSEDLPCRGEVSCSHDHSAGRAAHTT